MSHRYPRSYSSGPRHLEDEDGPPSLITPYQSGTGTPEDEEEMAFLQRLEQMQQRREAGETPVPPGGDMPSEVMDADDGPAYLQQTGPDENVAIDDGLPSEIYSSSDGPPATFRPSHDARTSPEQTRAGTMSAAKRFSQQARLKERLIVPLEASVPRRVSASSSTASQVQTKSDQTQGKGQSKPSKTPTRREEAPNKPAETPASTRSYPNQPTSSPSDTADKPNPPPPPKTHRTRLSTERNQDKVDDRSREDDSVQPSGAVPAAGGGYNFRMRPDIIPGHITGSSITNPNPKHSGQCATEAQYLTGTIVNGELHDAPPAGTWRPGNPVGPNTPIGTMIAIGWKDGKYPNATSGNHTGIFMGMNEDGTMRMLDQSSGQTIATRRYETDGYHEVVSDLKYDRRPSDSTPTAQPVVDSPAAQPQPPKRFLFF